MNDAVGVQVLNCVHQLPKIKTTAFLSHPFPHNQVLKSGRQILQDGAELAGSMEEALAVDDARVTHTFEDLAFDEGEMFSVLTLQLVLVHFLEGVLLGVDGSQENHTESSFSDFILDF